MLKDAVKWKSIEKGGATACILRFKRRGLRYVLYKPLAKCQTAKFFEGGPIVNLKGPKNPQFFIYSEDSNQAPIDQNFLCFYSIKYYPSPDIFGLLIAMYLWLKWMQSGNAL